MPIAYVTDTDVHGMLIHGSLALLDVLVVQVFRDLRNQYGNIWGL